MNRAFAICLMTAVSRSVSISGGGTAYPQSDQHLEPLVDTQNARRSRAFYFRRAMEAFGKVQVTRPYLPVSSANMCVTVSASFKREGKIRVTCGDIRWQKIAGDQVNFRRV